MGTNTFQLLVAEPDPSGGLHILTEQEIFVRIGRGGISQGLLTAEAMQRALAAMETFHQEWSRWQPDRVVAVATSATRSARNAPELLSQIEQATGVYPTVISGELEAELIYKGVLAEGLLTSTALVMDIGGGSVEFILADSGGAFWKTSLEIGGQRLLDRFIGEQDPVSHTSLREMEHFLSEALAPVLHQVQKFCPDYIVGSAGAFETMAAICGHHHRHTQPTTHHQFSFRELEAVYLFLTHMKREERQRVHGLIPQRVDTIVAASALMHATMRLTGLRQVAVARYSLKEGVAWHLLHGGALTM